MLSLPTPRFTAGPWSWSDRYTLRPADPDPTRQHVHTILEAESIGWAFAFSDYRDATPESDANMALIAAAPDLYDAACIAARVLATGRSLHRRPTDLQSIALAKLLAALEKASEPLRDLQQLAA